MTKTTIVGVLLEAQPKTANTGGAVGREANILKLILLDEKKPFDPFFDGFNS